MDPTKAWEGLLSLDVGSTEFGYAQKRILVSLRNIGIYVAMDHTNCKLFPEKSQPPTPLETKQKLATFRQGCGRTAPVQEMEVVPLYVCGTI